MILKIARSGIISIRVISVFIILGLSSQPGISQILKKINLEEIPQRKVRQYIVSRNIDKMKDFSLIHASWKKNIDASTFHVIEKTFYLKSKLSDVWEFYRHANPFEMLNGKSLRFGLMISKFSNSVTYSDNSSFPTLDTGQVYFLDIKLIKGLFNVPVAFEFINIDPEKKIVELSYIDNNISRGKQTLQFFDDGEGRTRIAHNSYFKSESSFRDDFLYPYFHKKFIREFHRNMKHLIKDENL